MTRARQRLPGKMRKNNCPSRYLGEPSWLRSVLSLTGRPSATADDRKRKIAQFAHQFRRRRCALSLLTAIQYVSIILLRVSCQLRAFQAAWRVKLLEVVGCLRLTTSKSLYFRVSASEPLMRRRHADNSMHNRACFS